MTRPQTFNDSELRLEDLQRSTKIGFEEVVQNLRARWLGIIRQQDLGCQLRS